MQNKLHFAIHGHTAAELSELGLIVNAYLNLAESRAKRNIPMAMEDWAARLDMFLEFDEREILNNSGKITAEIAKAHAESEFEKYRIVQDQLFSFDFDKLVQQQQQNSGKSSRHCPKR